MQNDINLDDISNPSEIKIDASKWSDFIIHDPHNSIKNSMGLIGTSTNIGGAAANSAWAYHADSDFSQLYPKPTEYKLLTGEKIIKLFDKNNFCEVKEMTLKKVKLTKKFPFFEKTVKKFTRVKYNDSKCGIVQYDIDCDLNFFMKHTNWEYNSWSSNKMKHDLSQKED